MASVAEAQNVSECATRARAAQRAFAGFAQEQVDHAVAAVAWAGYSHAETLARLAIEDTGIGNYDDKVAKNRRKTLGTMRDLKGARSVGIIRTDPARGITEIAKPVGIVGVLTPVTNPGATVINNIMIVLKGGNGIILAPHPKGERTCATVVELARAALARVGAPEDLVQHVSLTASSKEESKQRAQDLMRQVDLVLVTAGPGNVKMAYSSGTPALGVGVGNAPVIIDPTATIDDAADKIVRSKIFDCATSCSSENSLVVEATVYDAVVRALQARGGYLVPTEEKPRLQAAMWGSNAMLSREVVGQPATRIAQLAGLTAPAAVKARFLMVEEEGIGKAFPFSGEKISPVLTLYRYTTFDEALDTVERILAYQGEGHSCGIHTVNDEHVARLATMARVGRVLVNQPHCIGNGGDFANGLDFTLSLGAGTWGGNSTSDNITYRHFINITRVSRVIPAVVPTEEEMWGDYFARYGR
jgi:sulfoacetaldehyde dehydrogenase